MAARRKQLDSPENAVGHVHWYVFQDGERKATCLLCWQTFDYDDAEEMGFDSFERGQGADVFRALKEMNLG